MCSLLDVQERRTHCPQTSCLVPGSCLELKLCTKWLSIFQEVRQKMLLMSLGSGGGKSLYVKFQVTAH